MNPTLSILKHTLQVIKLFKRDNTNIFVFAFNRNKHAKIYLPSTFQTSDIELLAPKIETTSHNIHLPKSPKPDHIYKLCLYTLEEHKCVILTSLFIYVPKLKYSTHAQK